MTRIMFQMLGVEELAEWVHQEVNELEQESINGVMTLYTHLADFEQFLSEHPEINERFSEWLEEPSEVH